MTASTGGSLNGVAHFVASLLQSTSRSRSSSSSRNSSQSSSRSSSYASSTQLLAATIGGAITSIITALVCRWIHISARERICDEMEKRRQEERIGRIRAEVKLRKALIQIKQTVDGSNNDREDGENSPMMVLSCIGTIISPYPKRMGTPRQGALVPSSRGCIQFNSSLPSEAVDGIADYSHVWIIFWFHANTSLATSKKTKIRPPRGGGIKVGQLATRSPHRPNPLGLSLVQIETWDPTQKRLYIRGLDLVSGTPVYDIKPYVHWDMPAGGFGNFMESFRVPKWVESRDDVLASVEFTQSAEIALDEMVNQHNKLSPLYDKRDPTALRAAKKTLREILAQDPRSSHKGLSGNQRGSVATSTTDPYKLRFVDTEIEFVVLESGAQVVNITVVQEDKNEIFDENLQEE